MCTGAAFAVPVFLSWGTDMNMYLYYAIGFSGIGVMLMLRFYNGAGVTTMILGIICMVLGSIHGKKWQESRENKD